MIVMNPLYLDDLFISIITILNDFKMIVKLELLSKYHQNKIRKNNWYIPVKIKNDIILRHVINKYRLKNLDLSCKSFDINIFIKELKNCHTLDLYGTAITDESVKELKNCHKLYLAGTKITDASVKELKNCHTLYLYDTKITNTCVNELRLNGCIIYK